MKYLEPNRALHDYTPLYEDIIRKKEEDAEKQKNED